jgi:hypothetical protein
LGQAHLSNFLHSRRQLSLEAMDRVLAAQHLTAADLLPPLPPGGFWPADEERRAVPIVSHARRSLSRSSALPRFSPCCICRPASCSRSRPRFQPAPRLAAVCRRAHSAADALPMEPLVLPEAIALIDRHYNSLMPYRPNRPNLYAVRHGSHLTLRYVDFLSNRLVLRPHNIAFPVDLIEGRSRRVAQRPDRRPHRADSE